MDAPPDALLDALPATHKRTRRRKVNIHSRKARKSKKSAKEA